MLVPAWPIYLWLLPGDIIGAPKAVSGPTKGRCNKSKAHLSSSGFLPLRSWKVTLPKPKKASKGFFFNSLKEFYSVEKVHLLFGWWGEGLPSSIRDFALDYLNDGWFVWYPNQHLWPFGKVFWADHNQTRILSRSMKLLYNLFDVFICAMHP